MFKTSINLKQEKNLFKGFGLLANRTIAQPNGLSYIGTAVDLKDLTAFLSFQKKQGVFNFFFEKDLKYDFSDIPSYYRNFNMFSKLKNIEEVLLIGTFPRYEASVLNVYIRKILNKFKNKIYTISNWNENNFEIMQLGNSFKTTLEVLKGKHFLLKNLVKSKSFLLTTSLNYLTTKYNTNNYYLNKILIKKNYLNYNSKNILNVISPNLTSLISREFFFVNNSKSPKLYDNFRNNLKNIEILYGLNIQEKYLEKSFAENLKRKNSSFFLFSTHNWNSSNLKNEVQMHIPIQNYFEKNNFILNIDGKLQNSDKITSVQNNQIKNLTNFVENFFYYNDEKSSFYDRESLIKSWNNSIVLLTDKRIFNSVNYFKKFSKFSKDFLNNNYIQNFGSFYKKKSLFNFYNLIQLVKFSKKKIKIYTYTNQIKNFYQTDLLSNYSYVMSLTTLFTELNNSIKTTQGTDLKNNSLKKTNLLINSTKLK